MPAVGWLSDLWAGGQASRPGVAPDASAGARAAAAVRSAPEKCGAYVLEHDADYTGADLGVDAVAASSVGACCSACERVRLCNAFTFVAAEQQCWLKARRRMARAAPQPGALVSGHRSQLKRAGARLGFGSRGTGGGAGAAGGASAAGVQAPRRRLARPHADYAATLRLQQERQTEQLLAHAAALWRLDDGPPPPPPRFRLSLPLDAPPYTSDGAAAAPSAAMWVAWADDGAPSALLVCEAAAEGLVAAAAGRPAAGRALRARSEADGGGGAGVAEAVAAEVAVAAAAAPPPRRRARVGLAASEWRQPLRLRLRGALLPPPLLVRAANAAARGGGAGATRVVAAGALGDATLSAALRAELRGYGHSALLLPGACAAAASGGGGGAACAAAADELAAAAPLMASAGVEPFPFDDGGVGCGGAWARDWWPGAPPVPRAACGAGAPLWYRYGVGSLMVVALSPAHPMGAGSPQHSFARASAAAARRTPHVRWVVAVAQRPADCAPPARGCALDALALDDLGADLLVAAPAAGTGGTAAGGGGAAARRNGTSTLVLGDGDAGDCARGSPVCSAPSGSYARLEARDGELRVEVVRARDGTVHDSFAVPPRR